MDLLNELYRSIDRRYEHPNFSLSNLDVTPKAHLKSGGVGLAKISVWDRYFEFDNKGQWALVLGCWIPDEPSIYSYYFGIPELIDLIAFDPRQPDLWWYRLSEFDHILGRSQLARGPCATHADPLSWLRHECDGVCDLAGLERQVAA